MVAIECFNVGPGEHRLLNLRDMEPFLNTVLKYSPVDACFCVSCGNVFLLKVRNPEKFI